MKERRYTIFIILWIFLIPESLLFSQKYVIDFKSLTIKEGLSQGSIYCLLQDKKGFICIGTEDGLNRYDGYNFKIYRYNSEDKNCINKIHSQ